MATISLERVTLEFPIYNARGRSLTGELFRRAVGGHIRSDDSSHISVVALRDINLKLVDGGPPRAHRHNGAGKSTLLRVLAGVYEPPSGRAWIEGTVASLTVSHSRILVIASHDVEIIRRFCNRAALMETGRIVSMGPVDQVIAAYLGGQPDMQRAIG